MEEIIVRKLQPRDLPELIELNKREVKEWHYYDPKTGNLGKKASYDDLSPFERYLNGGFRVDPACMDLYYEMIKSYGEIFVAENQSTDEIVAEVEIIYSSEPQPIGRISQIIWVLVRHESRFQGIGIKVLRYAIERIIKNRTDFEYIDTVINPSNKSVVSIFEHSYLKPWKTVSVWHIPENYMKKEITDDVELFKRPIIDMPIGFSRISDLSQPTTYLWRLLEYYDKFAKLFAYQGRWSKSVECYNIVWEGIYGVISTHYPEIFLWIEPGQLTNEKAIKRFIESTIGLISEKNIPLSDLRLNLFSYHEKIAENLKLKIEIPKKSYFRRNIQASTSYENLPYSDKSSL